MRLAIAANPAPQALACFSQLVAISHNPPDPLAEDGGRKSEDLFPELRDILPHGTAADNSKCIRSLESPVVELAIQ